MLAYWVVAGFVVAMAIASLIGEGKRARYTWARLPAPEPASLPPATVVVPVKGEDEGLGDNLASLAALDYPDFELIVAVRRAADVPQGSLPPNVRLVVAGTGSAANGEKINNLLAAVRDARPESQVLAFADSDGKVREDWLRGLVAALEEPNAGAATGYRWHAPASGGFWSLLRSAWNGVIAGTFGPGDSRFAWGGAMAIRREMFDSLQVADFWKGAVSDDYRLSEAVHRAGLRIVYAPAAAVVTMDHTGAGEFLGWSRRQMMITRFYAPHLWWLALSAHVVYCAAMATSAVLALRGEGAAAGALILQVGAGMLKARNRVNLAQAALPDQSAWFRRYGSVHIWLTPLATWAWLWGLTSSAFGDTIEWRGRRYRLGEMRRERLTV